MKVPGLYKVWLHTLEPPEQLSYEDHYIILQDTVNKDNMINKTSFFMLHRFFFIS